MKLTISILEDQPIEAEHLILILNKWSFQAKCGGDFEILLC